MATTSTGATFSKGSAVMVRRTDDRGYRLTIWRPMTHGEKELWYASDDAKGMTDDGETKLCPQDVYRQAGEGEVFRVVRAMAQARRGYYTIKGCCALEDAQGVIWFAKRDMLY